MIGTGKKGQMEGNWMGRRKKKDAKICRMRMKKNGGVDEPDELRMRFEDEE